MRPHKEGDWPLGQDTLQEFLNLLNLLHKKIQFNMETKQVGQLPSLDIDIYRKSDGARGPKIYRKPTHTNLYLQENLNHHPANKVYVLTSLVHRAKTLCDQDFLPQEFEFPTAVLKLNGYSQQQIDEPWEQQLRPPRTMTNPQRPRTCHTHRRILDDLTEC
jgi:pterin-4a-carbinolamine dehydratase